MYCRKCGEENPDNAVFCRNCGEKLQEEVKKAEIIDNPINDNQQNQQSTVKKSSGSDATSWIACCCIGLFVVFILSAIFSGI